MSSTHFSWAFPARPEDVTSSLRSLDDVGHLLPSGDAPPHLLMSASRHGWLLTVLTAIARALNLTHLASFQRALAVIPASALGAASEEIDAVLRWAQTRPAACATVLGQGDDAAEILRALAESAGAATPHLGPDGAEDGDSARYLFDWLKSLQAILRAAEVGDRSVVHVRPSGPDHSGQVP